MDAVEFLKEWKRFRKEEHKTNCIICKNRDRSIEKRGMCVCNSEENLVDCMIRNIDIVENWSKTHPVLNLTEQQKTAIRGRIAEGYLWVSRDKKESFVCFSVEKPYKEFFNSEEYTLDSEYSVSISNDFYDFVTFENPPLYLPDLLGGEKKKKNIRLILADSCT